MSYLIDTNILSEGIKKNPNPKVVAWLKHHENKLYVSVISLAEIYRGIERLDHENKKKMLFFWLESLCTTLEGRILHFNHGTARHWGKLKSDLEKRGLTIPSLDAQIAATAAQHHLTLVTRNTKDFVNTGLELFNPFENESA